MSNVEVSAFQLIQFKAAIKLERVGLKHSSGRSVAAHVKKLFKLPRSTSHDALITMIETILKGETQCATQQTPQPST